MAQSAKKKTNGDVIKINVLPPIPRFPWIHFYVHPYGIKHAGEYVGECSAGKDADKVAMAIGKEVIKASKVLTKWLRQK